MMYWAIKILGNTGMRISELLQLTWADVLAGEFYPLCKGKKKRLVVFPKRLAEEAKLWVSENEVDCSLAVLHSRHTGGLLSKRGVAQALHAAAEHAGIRKEVAHCHAFRHFFAKQYLKRTKDVIQLAEILGHENMDTTRLYLQKSKDEHVRDINRNVTW